MKTLFKSLLVLGFVLLVSLQVQAAEKKFMFTTGPNICPNQHWPSLRNRPALKWFTPPMTATRPCMPNSN